MMKFPVKESSRFSLSDNFPSLVQCREQCKLRNRLSAWRRNPHLVVHRKLNGTTRTVPCRSQTCSIWASITCFYKPEWGGCPEINMAGPCLQGFWLRKVIRRTMGCEMGAIGWMNSQTVLSSQWRLLVLPENWTVVAFAPVAAYFNSMRAQKDSEI